MPHSNEPLRLASHVRACLVGDQMIFLDMLRSRYFGIAGPQLEALSAALRGSTPPGEPPSPATPAALQLWTARLRNQQLLSNTPAKNFAEQPLQIIEPTISLNADEECRDSTGDWRLLPSLWRATFFAAMWLRRRSLADIAKRVAALRDEQLTREVPVRSDAMLSAVAAYTRLRPFALTSHDRCLNDSLTLIHFLAGQGLFPRWVIGVRTHPFSAHSWVQSGDIVVNDLAERVRNFRPILVV